MAVAMVVLNRMLPHSENAVLVVITRALVLAVAGGDDLVEKVRSLLVERQIPQFITDEQSRLGVDPKFAHQGVIDLGSQQVVQHVHGGGEEGPHIGLAGSPAEDLGKVCFARPGIADQDNVGAVLQEVEIEQPEDAAFALHPRSCGAGSERCRCWAGRGGARGGSGARRRGGCGPPVRDQPGTQGWPRS